jgi:hypothetical protein
MAGELPLIFQKKSVEIGTVSAGAGRLSRHHRVVPSASLDKSKVLFNFFGRIDDHIGRYYMFFGGCVKRKFGISRFGSRITPKFAKNKGNKHVQKHHCGI